MSVSTDDFIHNHHRLDGRAGRDGQTARPIPLGSTLPPPEAYARQHQLMRAFAAEAGIPLAGFKISMTNAADQVAVRASEPAYGHLTPLHLAENEELIVLDSANHPLVEPELVFRVNRDIDDGFSAAQIAEACDVTAGLEIPICRLLGWWPLGDVPKLSLSDFILDNAGAGRVVHGRDFLPASALDLSSVRVRLTAPDGEVHIGQGLRVLENPLNAMLWLAGALARRGEVIPAGSIISSGTFMPPLRAVPGVFRAEFSDELGAVQARFE